MISHHSRGQQFINKSSVTSVYPAVSGCLNQQSWSWASYVGRWKNRGRQRWPFRLSGKDWRSTSTCLKHTSLSTSKTATLRRTCAWRLPRNAVSVWMAAYLEHPLMHLSGHSVIIMVCFLSSNVSFHHNFSYGNSFQSKVTIINTERNLWFHVHFL